jgi:hypothetical protein
MNAHIDHKYKINGGPYLQHLSRLPGDNGDIYNNREDIIELNDTSTHNIRIDIIDAYDNASSLHFQVQYDEAVAKGEKTNTWKRLVPGYLNIFEQVDFEVYMPEGCLYDTANAIYYKNAAQTTTAITAAQRFGDPAIPIHGDFVVKLKPLVVVKEDQRNKVVIARQGGAGRSVRVAIWQQGWISASFSDFGDFHAYLDLTAPSINTPPGKGQDTIDLSPLQRIVFTPTDNSAIASFRAELNGKWLMFTNDKGRNHIYNFDEQVPYGVHELKVIVKDIVGNTVEKTWWFKRNPYTPPKKKFVKKKSTKKKPVRRKKR